MNLTEQYEGYQATKQKAARYCSYQERTIAEVREKLKAWGIHAKTIADSLVQALQKEGFLDEQRYVAAFVRAKFSTKKWGKCKIRYELMKKELSPALIQQALDLIEEPDYLGTMQHLVLQKKQALTTQAPALANPKLMNYLLQKGYEPDLIQKVIQDNPM